MKCWRKRCSKGRRERHPYRGIMGLGRGVGMGHSPGKLRLAGGTVSERMRMALLQIPTQALPQMAK